LRNALAGARVITAEEAGWRGDFVEAEAFAYLAVRSLYGLPISFPTTTGVRRPMTGGTLNRAG
jgi:anhydro-N-acetylmuramic acid kinase